MKKVLVTGGMGFIGNHLVRRLLNQGVEVIILDSNILRPGYHAIDAARFIEGNTLSKALLRDLLSQVDTCFHLAALASIALCERDWLFSYTNNALAFNGLLDEIWQCPNPPRLIYASSAAVYGNNPILPLQETCFVSPLSNYGCDKLCNELYAGMMARMAGIQTIGLRLFNVYGPGQSPQSAYSGVISHFKKAILAKQKLVIYGDGLQTRDFIYVDDVVDAFILAAETDFDEAKVFNVCRGEAMTIDALARLMIQLTHHTGTIDYQPARQGDLMHSLGGTGLAQDQLGFRAKTSMEEGLERFLNE